MQRNKKIRYKVAAVATAALLLTGVLFTKKCMDEDIKKRMKPEGPKKGIVIENTKYNDKKMTKELAKLITSVTPVEENIDENKEPEPMNEDVKKIIDEFPYEKLNCEKIPAEKVEEYEALAKEEMDAILFHRTQSDPIEDSIKKLGEEGKIDELISILNYYESLGSHYTMQNSAEMELTLSESFDYFILNRKNTEDGEDIYDPVCVTRHFHLNSRVGQVLKELSNIWIKNEDDIDNLVKIVPETYKPALAGSLISRLLSSAEISPEYFNDSMYLLVETYSIKQLRFCIRMALIAGKKDATMLENFIEQIDNEKLKKELNDILEDHETYEKTFEERSSRNF